MTKINKNILLSYLNLKGKKADVFLVGVAREIVDAIKKAKTNEEIIEELVLLDEFVYRVPEQAIQAISIIRKYPITAQIVKNILGEHEGKSHSEIVVKSIGLLEKIRYIKPDEVLPMLADLIQSDDRNIKQESLRVLRAFSRYDYNLLTKTKIGYGAQRKALDFILTWSDDDKLVNLDFIEVVGEAILSSSIEGTSSPSVDTLTMHFGVVNPTDFLKKMRREVIDMVERLFRKAQDEVTQLKFLGILEEASRTPSNVAYGDKVKAMVSEDGKYILEFFNRILFDEKGELIARPAIILEIDRRLYWFPRWGITTKEEAKKLRDLIHSDRFYGLFRLLVGEDGSYGDDDDWQSSKQERSKQVDELVQRVSAEPLTNWINDLVRIASEVGPIEEYHFAYFRVFLRKLSAVKSDYGNDLIQVALYVDSALRQFMACILDGLRDAQRTDLWDNAVAAIAKESDASLAPAICFSLNYDREDVNLENVIREEDLDILDAIVHRTIPFGFLATSEVPAFQLHYSLINALARNYKRDPDRLESLIVSEITGNPNFRNIFASELSLGIWKGWVDYSTFSKESKALFVDWIIELPDLDWQSQIFLIGLAKADPHIITDVFWGRIERDAKRKKDHKNMFGIDRYEPIPYHFNPELQKCIVENPDFLTLVQPWLKHLTEKWSPYNWNIGQFLERSGLSLHNVIHSIIAKGDDASLAKAANLMSPLNGTNIDLCVEIAAKTDNKKIINHVGGLLFSTGVVSGEDGISRTYESRAQEMGKYLESDNPRIKKFAESVIHDLKERAAKERVSAVEEKALRQIEFEG